MADYTPTSELYWLAMRAIQQGAGQAVEAGTNAINTGTGYLNQKTNAANATLAPISQGSYAALDFYFDLLGIPRAAVGSAKIASAASTDMYDPEAKNKIKAGLMNIRNSAWAQGGGGAANVIRNDIDSALASNDETKMYNSLKSYTGWDGNFAGLGSLAKSQLTGITPNTAKALELNSTEEGRAQMALAKQIKDGTVANTTPTAESTQAALINIPGYKFALDQGVGAVQTSAAAKGMLNSGATVKGIADYATGLADQTYTKQVGLLHNAFGGTSPAAGQTATNEMNLGNLLNQNQGYLADLGANATLTSATAISSLYAGRAAQQYAQEHMQSSSGYYPQLNGSL